MSADRRASPPIQWSAVAIGAIVGIVVGAVATSFGIGPFGPSLGMAAGGATVGRLARTAPLLHGALVAVVWILLNGLIPGPLAPAGLLADTAATVLSDSLYMCTAAAAGWLAGRGRGG
ncbi:MAG: hypothetical protein HY071_05155 [Chloroflexi bacterium]|nr:hypothetical protein [Chloroflexota bacterium]